LHKAAVVIPHYSGGEILCRCLHSLRRTAYRDFEIVVVDNGCPDGSVQAAEKAFPEIRVVRSAVNLGFAGGCNLGIRTTTSPFVVLLNNDTEVDAGWLEPLVRTAEADSRIAAIQPKILSLHNRQRFDYCGAAGGEMDLFGYPFAWGRLFESIEEDHGQFERPKEVFWATGAAVLLRKSALNRIGLLDETFFAHMEEIDLDFRLHWAGYEVVFQPESVVYHQTGGTLGEDDLRKMVLNHRNSILMLLKNHTAATLSWLFPMRLLLEAVTVAASLLKADWKRAIAVLSGLAGAVKCWRTVVAGRKCVASLHTRSETALLHRMYRGSVALEYYLCRRTKAGDLVGIRGK